MILKVVTILVLVGACYALPVEESTQLQIVPHAGPIQEDPTPTKLEALAKPASPDNSDLKPEASSWWHGWHHHEIPVYPVYHVEYIHSVPHYSYFHHHW